MPGRSPSSKQEMLDEKRRKRRERKTESNAAISPDQSLGGAAHHHHHPPSPVRKGCMEGRFVPSPERFSSWKFRHFIYIWWLFVIWTDPRDTGVWRSTPEGSNHRMNQPSTNCQWWNYRPVRVYNRHQEDVANGVDAGSKLKAHARIHFATVGPDLARARPWLCLLCLFWGLALTRAHPAAKRLHDDLLSDYNRLIRPVGNHSHKVIIHLGLKLSQLIDIVSKQLHFIGW